VKIEFSKYHGTGNDFIMIDDRTLTFPSDNRDLIRQICHRRFGIGGDGLILVRDHGTLDFRMVYFNADGNEGSMCGNGGRCAAAFAYHLGMAGEQTVFEAIDGIHEADLVDSENIRIKLQDVRELKKRKDYFLVDTGSPHYVKFVQDLDKFDMVKAGREIRYDREFKKDGINVNFVELRAGELWVRTYERGVEDETLSCGTGVVAAAICSSVRQSKDNLSVRVRTAGGCLQVAFNKVESGKYSDIYLEGPATYVFKGSFQTEIILPRT